MVQLRWTRGSAPDRTPRVPIQVFNVPVGEPTTVRFLGSPYCCFVHGQNRRSYPCVLPEYPCPFCRDHNDQIPAGYAAAQFWGKDANRKDRWITCVCSLTDKALEHMRDKDLRGCVYRMCRSSTAYNAKLLCHYLQCSMVGLPDEFDPVPIVLQCWANYLATFNVAATAPSTSAATGEVVPPSPLIPTLGNHFGAEIDQADAQQRREGVA